MITRMTTLADILDPKVLQEEIDGGFVKANRHPELPLTIYTYTRNCQYEGRWNAVTTLCRGLIVDNAGTVIARPFPKFFNYGEHGVREYAPQLTPEPFEVYEKVDGSLGILFYYDEYWRIASKGSFISEQAQWATKVIENRHADLSGLDDYLTYCCEILYPQNRIVVNYGDREDLVLLGVFEPDGTEVPLDDVAQHWHLGSVVETFTSPTLDDLLSRCETNQDVSAGTDAEGFVVRFASGLRVKIKYAEYVRLHRILTGINERDIWRAVAFDSMTADGIATQEIVRSLRCSADEVGKMQAAQLGALATIVDGCPDEFDKWVQSVSLSLRQSFQMMVTEAKLAFAMVREAVGIEDRGAFAKHLTTTWKDNKTVVSSVFAMLDEKPVAPLIWRSLYPAASTPFVEDDEG